MVRTYNLKRDKRDHSRHLYTAHLSVADVQAQLPTVVDLREFMPPIVNQGELGSCTANSMAGFLGSIDVKAKDTVLPYSRLFIYYNERSVEGTIYQDAGASIADGMQSLVKIGACYESEWPYDIRKFTQKPDQKNYENAASHKLASVSNIPDFDGVKHALANGNPVVFGIEVFESFESEEVAKTGIIPMPLAGEQNMGGHAVLAVGYDDNKKVVIVRNSWGEEWGDKGYFYLPYDFFTNDLAFDFWTGNK